MKHKKMAPGRVIALGFATVILTGAVLLMLPVSHDPGVEVSTIDALFTSTSAVCVTGLVVVDTADTFSAFGCAVVAALIQIGGLGVTSVGIGLIVFSGKRIHMRQRLLAKEGMNYPTFKGVLGLLKAVLCMTLCFETAGTLLSFLSFRHHFPLGQALGVSVFHSIASFNNAGFDVLGNMTNLIPYENDVLLNLTTCFLIIFGGLGFFVIYDILKTRSFRHFSLHSKVVLSMTAALLLSGTLLLKATENISWLAAFFQSTSARTAGFATVPIGGFSNAGLLTLCVLMFIGASPGSTGGGIKTSTFFLLLQALFTAATNKPCCAFKRKLPAEVVHKAFVIAMLAAGLVCSSTFLLCVLEPQTEFMKLLFETVSAFGTVGLSTGITPTLTTASKTVIILTMYIGRLGPLAAATLWLFKPSAEVSFAEESVSIG